MVASKKKIKAQQNAEGVEAMAEERRLKVKKRKEGKHQAAKEAVKVEKAAAAAVETKNVPEQEHGDDELVLNVKESAGGNPPATKQNGKRKKQQQSKDKKKKQRVDRWGAPIAAAGTDGEAQEEQRNEDATAAPAAEQQYMPRRVFVSGMPFTTTTDEIHSYFTECGVIEELDASYFQDTGNFNGMAFITFKTEAAMNNALAMDGSDMGGRYLKIQKCKLIPQKQREHKEPPPKTDGCLSAYVGNLSWDLTEESLREFFSGSNILAVRFAEDKVTKDFKGYAHVDFADDESLEKAVKLNQEMLLGRPVKIAYAVGSTKNRDRDANKNRDSSKKAKGCFKCGQEGHFAAECPKF